MSLVPQFSLAKQDLPMMASWAPISFNARCSGDWLCLYGALFLVLFCVAGRAPTVADFLKASGLIVDVFNKLLE